MTTAIKATIQDVRDAFGALTRLNEETKLGQDAAWSVARMIRKLKTHVKEYERVQLKMYKDHGGIVVGNGIEIPPMQPRAIGKEGFFTESLEDYEKRFDVYRERANKLSNELEGANAREVDVELEPLKLSIFPKKHKNDKGEEVETNYNGNHFANAGPFIVREGD